MLDTSQGGSGKPGTTPLGTREIREIQSKFTKLNMANLLADAHLNLNKLDRAEDAKAVEAAEYLRQSIEEIEALLFNIPKEQ